jgi:hypothetical protein
MSIPSNLYAQKVFGEHPLAIWPLDEKIDYASIISVANSDVDAQWTATTLSPTGLAISGLTKSSYSLPGPIESSPTSQIIAPSPGSNSYAIVRLESPALTSLQNLEASIGTLTFATWFNPVSADITMIELGYTYTDPATSEVVDVLESFDISINNVWQLVSTNKTVPNINATIKMLIRITYNKSTTPSPIYSFLLNGVSAGHLAEEFVASSFGVLSSTLPASTLLPETQTGVSASKYGVNTYPAYHIVKNNFLRAKNFGVPLVFGSSSSTTLLDNDGLPSLIVPGLGFMNNDGKYKDMTFESWIRVNSGSVNPVRVIGPISSDDGLYVNQSFLTLKINGYIASHPVSEWGRPMLVDIRLTNNSASLLLNGERVISITTDTEFLSFSTTQDWIGFYSSSEIGPVAIDCVAIYPYSVPEVVAKRRWVYGQGVDFPDNVNSSYSSTAVVADYGFANYANNYNYPESSNWSSGLVENLSVQKNLVSSPSYKLPEVYFDTRDISDWYADINVENISHITLKPKEDWADVDGYMLFNSFNPIDQKVKAFYGIFKKVDSISTKQILFKIINDTSGNYLEASLSGTTLSYVFVYNNESLTIKTSTITGNSYFAAGFDIDVLVEAIGQNLSAFFGDREYLKLYVAGNKDFTNTFSGEINSINFATSFIANTISSRFGADGIISYNSSLLGAVSSYTLVMRESLIGNILDIRTKSNWADYVPISYFSKYVKNSENESYYSVDLLQFNIGFPEPNIFADDTILNDRVFDTTGSKVRTYISFQDLTTKATKPASDFSLTLAPLADRTVEPGKYIVDYDLSDNPIYDNWETTIYEVVNNSIIYPPVGVDINNLAIAVQIEIITDGSQYDPITIKSLQLSSLSFNDISKNVIGSRFGVPVVPYTKLGIYEDYKRRNPFTIYKGSTPYLYLTNHSGFGLVGKPRTGVNRGLSMPINQGMSDTYKVGALQIFLRYDAEEFPQEPIEAFEIEANNAHIKFYLVADDQTQKRGKIYGLNTTTGAIEEGMVFYINGLMSTKAVINLNEWAILGIQFGTKLDFGYYNNSLPATKGAFRITGPLTINNIAHFQYTAEQEQQAIKIRPWREVLTGESGDNVWSYWNENFIWKDVLYLLTTEKGNIDPAQIFNIYTGTNRLIFSDEKSLGMSEEPYRVYKDIAWKSILQSAI